MARPINDGLKYFSLDTDFFFGDRRIKILRSKYGSDGVLFYIYLLTEIYRNSFYIRWDEDTKDSCVCDLNFTEGFIEQVLEYLLGRSLLTKVDVSTLAKPVTIITSPGIQKRWQAAKKELKRDIVVDPQMWLLKEEETAAFIKFTQNSDKPKKNYNKSPKNDDKSENNALKEKKEKENKINEIKVNYNNYSMEQEQECKDAFIKKLFKDYFNKNATKAEIELMKAQLILHSKEDIQYAFGEAAIHDKRTLAYVAGILRKME